MSICEAETDRFGLILWISDPFKRGYPPTHRFSFLPDFSRSQRGPKFVKNGRKSAQGRTRTMPDFMQRQHTKEIHPYAFKTIPSSNSRCVFWSGCAFLCLRWHVTLHWVFIRLRCFTSCFSWWLNIWLFSWWLVVWLLLHTWRRCSIFNTGCQ